MVIVIGYTSISINVLYGIWKFTTIGSVERVMAPLGGYFVTVFILLLL